MQWTDKYTEEDTLRALPHAHLLKRLAAAIAATADQEDVNAYTREVQRRLDTTPAPPPSVEWYSGGARIEVNFNRVGAFVNQEAAETAIAAAVEMVFEASALDSHIMLLDAYAYLYER